MIWSYWILVREKTLLLNTELKISSHLCILIRAGVIIKITNNKCFYEQQLLLFQNKCIYGENICWLEFLLYTVIKPIYQLPDRRLLQTGIDCISVCFVCWLVWILCSNLNSYKRYFTAKDVFKIYPYYFIECLACSFKTARSRII